MTIRRQVLLLFFLSILLFVAVTPVVGWDKKAARAAAQEATDAFSSTTFIAKLTLGAAQQYFVLPDGSPATKSGKRQGKGGASSSTLWMPGGNIRLREGETGHSIMVWAKKDEVMVGLHDKPGKVLNAAIVHILVDGDTTPGDFDPAKIAEALVSLVEIEGFEPGSDIAEAFDETIASFDESSSAAAKDAEPSSSPPLPSGPTVVSLQVTAESASGVVTRGGEVQLVLSYQLSGSDEGISVTETRTLRLGEETMPTFPAVDELTRSTGPVRSTFGQPLPSSIAPGTYTFEGKVCVGGDCIQRSVEFELR